eukprot:jgi/Hompol1/4234/HPOL_001182-RA
MALKAPTKLDAVAPLSQKWPIPVALSSSSATPNNTIAGCFLLQPSSTQCPAQAVSSPPILSTSQYSSSESFDAFLLSRSVSAPQYIQDFRAGYDCPAFNGLGTRYHSALTCALIVDSSAAPCSGMADQAARMTPPLCSTTCLQSVSALASLFANQTTCSPVPSLLALQNRISTLSTFSQFCAKLTVPNQASGSCIDGTLQPNESISCGEYYTIGYVLAKFIAAVLMFVLFLPGFPTSDEALAYCARSSSIDPCCGRIAIKTTTSSSHNTSDMVPDMGEGPTMRSGNSPNMSSTQMPPASGMGDSGMPSVSRFFHDNERLIIIVAFSSVLGIIAIATGLWFALKFRKRPSKQGKYGTADLDTATSITSLDSVPNFDTTVTFNYDDNDMDPMIPVQISYLDPDDRRPIRNGLSKPSPSTDTTANLPHSSVLIAPLYPAKQRDQSSSINAKSAPLRVSARISAGSSIEGDSQDRRFVASPTALYSQQADQTNISILADRASLVNRFVRVVAVFVPSLDDELSVKLGDTILVIATFDDGWARGRNVSTGREGVFPLACAQPEAASA